MEQVYPATDNPVQRAQRHSRLGVAYPGPAGQTKHPAPNKGMWRKSNERRATLKAACAKAALLFIQITLVNQFDQSLLEIFSLTEKQAKIWQDTSSFIMATVGLPPFCSYVLPVALGTLTNLRKQNLGSWDFYTKLHSTLSSSLALASTVPSEMACNAPRFHCS